MSTTAIPTIAGSITNQDLTGAKSAQAQRVLQNQKNSPEKIDKAARDFESILIGEWLQKAETSFGSVPGSNSGKDQDPGHDQFQSIGCQFLGEALSRAGGIGIASMISKHLKAVEANRAAEPEAAKTPDQ